MSGTEVIQAGYQLNDKLLGIRTRLRRLAEFTVGPVPPISRERSLQPGAPSPQQPPMLDQLLSTASANHDLADDLAEAVAWLERSFSVPDGPETAASSFR